MPIPKLDIQIILLAFAAVTGLAVLLQTIFLFAIFLSVRKAARGIQGEMEKLRSSLMPVILDTREILASSRDLMANAQELMDGVRGFLFRVTPKIENVTDDLAEITRVMRAQSVQIQSSAQEIMERVRRQSGRVDGMVTNVLDGIEHAGSFVVDVIGKPVRQVSAILASAKAVIESLRGSQASRRPNPSIGEDRFV